MPTFGAIYIAHNPTDGKDVYKVGLTERSVPERMAELTASTSNLGTYEAVGYVVVNDIQEAERRCHEKLYYCRVQDNREFFQECLESVVRVVRECCRPFEVKDFLPEGKAEEPPDVKQIVAKTLEKNADGKKLLEGYHSMVSERIRELLPEVSPSLKDLKESLPSENLKVVLYDPQLDLARQSSGNGISEIKLIDVMFFGKLVKPPIKIRVYRDSREFLQLSRVVQIPTEEPSSIGLGSSWIFDDDGRWLQVSGLIKCVWSKAKDKNDPDFLYAAVLKIKATTISCEGNRYNELASYKATEVSGYLSSSKDFVRVMTTVSADNANLCPAIDRYFTIGDGGGRSYINFNGGRVSQQPMLQAMKPYLPTDAKKRRK